MNDRVSPRTWLAIAFGLMAIGSAVVLGVAIRLDDPLSTSVIPAEDPYTHMAFVREHLRTGSLDPLYDGGPLYPPGMHGAIAAFWVFTGADLYETFRFAPVFLGALGILGIGMLLWRHIGLLAGFIGALGYAVAPELIFRTTMMSPTAVDLGLLPFYFYALLELVRGRLGWLGLALPFTAFFALMHPWVLWVLAATGGVFLLFSLVLPWPEHRYPGSSAQGLAAVIGVLGAGVAGAAHMGADDVLDVPGWLPLRSLAPLFLVISFVPLYLAFRFGEPVDRALSRWRAQRVPSWVRLSVGILFGLALFVVTHHASTSGMPEFVNLPAMIGWPILLLAAAGLVALPFARSPLSHLGAGLAVVTYPFVIFDVFSSPYWPHRTVAFLGIGLIMLVGVAAWTIEHIAQILSARAVERFAEVPAALAADVSRPRVAQLLAFTVPSVLVMASLGGGVVASVPEPYDGWYRLFTECEQEVLSAVADAADDDSGAVVVTGSWQAKAVVAALASNARRIWYTESFFEDAGEREDLVHWLSSEGRPLYVVIDRHLREQQPDLDLSFLDADPWHAAVEPCAVGDPPQVHVAAFEAMPSGRSV